MREVIIIGSGISGLTAALLLHRRGCKVRVMEQQALPGGALHQFRRQGIPFDVGFHYTGGLGGGEILQALWHYCGIADKVRPIAFPENGADCLHVDGFKQTIHAYFSYERIVRELCTLFPAEKDGIEQFFKTIRTTAGHNPFYNMSLPLTEFLRELAFPEEKTLGDLIRSCTADPFLQGALSHPVFLHGVHPDKIGLAMHTAVAHPVYSGMYTVRQGGQAIADAYLDRLQECGIQVLSSTPVEKILVENGKVAGVRIRDETFSADDVLYTGHPSLLPDLVCDKSLRKVYCSRLREMTNTSSMYVIFGVTRDEGAGEKLRWNNYYSLPGGLAMPGKNAQRPEDCFFVSGCGLRNGGGMDKRSTGCSVIIMRPMAWEEAARFDLGRKKRSPEYAAWKEEECTKLIRSIKAKWDGLLDGFQVINTASPLTFRDELRYVRGSAYGVQHSVDQFSVGARTRLPGLWLSGQSTLMTGIIGAALSGLVTVGSMTDLESLWNEVRNSI